MKVAVSKFAAAIAALAMAPAWAAGTWDFSVCDGSKSVSGTASGTSTSGGSQGLGNSYACAANGSTTRDLSVTAWGASSSNGTYTTAYVSNQGTDGFGVGAQSEGGSSATSPNTALDNDPTTIAPNLILLKFNSAVILDQVTLGWSMNDADLTIMAYTGSGTPTSFLSGKSASSLTSGGASAGWSLVQNVGDVDSAWASGSSASSTNINYGVNQGGVSSSYWLISAYNSSFGGGSMDGLVDYAKLLSVTTRDGTTGKVPEPASIALAAVALLALWGSRRRTV